SGFAATVDVASGLAAVRALPRAPMNLPAHDKDFSANGTGVRSIIALPVLVMPEVIGIELLDRHHRSLNYALGPSSVCAAFRRRLNSSSVPSCHRRTSSMARRTAS